MRHRPDRKASRDSGTRRGDAAGSSRPVAGRSPLPGGSTSLPVARGWITRSVRAASALVLLLLTQVGCRSEPPLFELRSEAQTGITFVNLVQEDDTLYNPLDFNYIYNGGGVAIADFNGNGLPDIYFTGNMVPNRLYLNRGDFRFDDVTEAAGVAAEGVWSTGVSVVDINQDGLPDIYVSVAGPGAEADRANLLFVNQGIDENGVPRFVEQAEDYGIADTGYSTHAVFFDYDLDGDLDLFLLTNAEDSQPNALRPRRLDGQAESTDRLYRNNGDGTFTDVSREAGILIEGYGLGVVVTDLDGDGWPDIYVANDFQPNDVIWINNRDGTFTNRAPEYLKVQSHAAMGMDIADINNNGLPDIVVLDMLPADNLRQKMMHLGGRETTVRRAQALGYQPQYARNTLQLNNGPGPNGEPSFSEIGQLAGVHATDWSWAALLADFDNDGFRDLFVSNGYGRDVTNLDFIAFSNRYLLSMPQEQRRAETRQAMRELAEVRIPNFLFRNNGDLTFTDQSRAWGLHHPSISHGVAYADLNNDGDLDLVVNNMNGPAFILENRSERLLPGRRNFLRLELRGPHGNLGGYGAKVTIRNGEMKQYHEHTPYRGYKSSVEQVVHFGVGSTTSVESLEIVWPDGLSQRLTNVPANQVLRLDHADAARRPPSEAAPPAYLFEPAEDGGGLSHRHHERYFDEFLHTPLLPHRHSQQGPGVAVGDVTGNGLDDVFVGADQEHPKEIFLQTAPGRFERRLLDAETRYEDRGALFFDANGDGHLDLYVVSGGAFLSEDGGSYQDRLYVNDGTGRFHRDVDALPRITASGATVIAADFDGDGDLDLFVGGRIVPGHYPLPARSYLLRNDTRPGGPPRFTDVTEELAPGLAEAGLVTSALWTDFDGDGQIDLVLVGEWMPITFFRNENGRFRNVTESTGLGATEGWWNSIVAGDFNNNGRTDYLVGNLGLNSRLRASEEQPVRVHAADLNGTGMVVPVLSHYIEGKSYPIAPRDFLVEQMFSTEFRFPRYIDYARVTLEQMLSAEERAKAFVGRSATFASSHLENLGGGKFAIRPLPLEAQVAPMFGMLVGDYDGDGELDVLMVGNSHATEPQRGRYTASTGAVLLGNGRGEFRHLNGARSGFLVDGDAKAIAEVLVGEERSLVIVTQNDDSVRIFSPAVEPAHVVRVQPEDAFALLTFADGKRRRDEFYHGSAYLSQSSRFLRISPGIREAVIYDFRGRSRTYRFP
jgi:enediyne biosynthesis protein E4